METKNWAISSTPEEGVGRAVFAARRERFHLGQQSRAARNDVQARRCVLSGPALILIDLAWRVALPAGANQ